MSDPMSPDERHRLRAYMSAVYPAARRWIHDLSDKQLTDHFEALDYFVASDPSSLVTFVPMMQSCTQIVRAHGASDASAPLPALGVYYRTSTGSRRSIAPFHDGSWSAHPAPLEVVWPRRPRDTLAGFRSSHGAKVGPALRGLPTRAGSLPAYPIGASAGGDAPPGTLRGAARRERHGGATFFDVRNTSRVQQLLALRDGDLVETEQWGGWALDTCPQAGICGLWGNVWKGTGLMMRVARPFASLSKITAIVEMILSLDGRASPARAAPATATAAPRLTALIRRLGISARVDAARARHPDATLAECAAFTLLTMHDHPCEGADVDGTFRPLLSRWLQRARRRGPRGAVADILTLGYGDGATTARLFSAGDRLRLLWIYSICGVGPLKASCGLGYDALLAALACLHGHQTVVLAASPNDNGLLHQEFVDYELPAALGGWGARGAPLDTCLDAFGFAGDDQRKGTGAVAERRRQIHAHWLRSAKFVMPREATDRFVLPAHVGREAVPCRLRFGPGAAHAEGLVHACRISPEDEERNQPTSKLACYAWCEGAMTQANSAVSLFHVARG